MHQVHEEGVLGHHKPREITFEPQNSYNYIWEPQIAPNHEPRKLKCAKLMQKIREKNFNN